MSKWPVHLDREILKQWIGSSREELGKWSRANNIRRQFVQSSYPAVKSANPDLKFLIREASNISPRAFVRFGASPYVELTPVALSIMTLADESPSCVERGVESEAQLANLSEPDVGKVLTHLVNQQSGAGVA